MITRVIHRIWLDPGDDAMPSIFRAYGESWKRPAARTNLDVRRRLIDGIPDALREHKGKPLAPMEQLAADEGQGLA